MVDVPAELAVAAVDVDGEETGAAVAAGGVGLADEGPDDVAVGLGEGEGLEFGLVEPVEATFADVVGWDFDGAEDAVDEHEPVAAAFELALADEAEEVDAVEGDVDAGFFLDFALSAHGG